MAAREVCNSKNVLTGDHLKLSGLAGLKRAHLKLSWLTGAHFFYAEMSPAQNRSLGLNGAKKRLPKAHWG